MIGNGKGRGSRRGRGARKREGCGRRNSQEREWNGNEAEGREGPSVSLQMERYKGEG